MLRSVEKSKLAVHQYITNVQYQFEFQTMHTSRGHAGVWYKTVLRDMPNGYHGALTANALCIYSQMQAVDRLIVFHLLGLLMNGGCLDFLPTASGNNDHQNSSMFTLYKRHKVRLSADAYLLENGLELCSTYLNP
jgi:hypothetical protein